MKTMILPNAQTYEIRVSGGINPPNPVGFGLDIEDQKQQPAPGAKPGGGQWREQRFCLIKDWKWFPPLLSATWQPTRDTDWAKKNTTVAFAGKSKKLIEAKTHRYAKVRYGAFPLPFRKDISQFFPKPYTPDTGKSQSDIGTMPIKNPIGQDYFGWKYVDRYDVYLAKEIWIVNSSYPTTGSIQISTRWRSDRFAHLVDLQDYRTHTAFVASVTYYENKMPASP